MAFEERVQMDWPHLISRPWLQGGVLGVWPREDAPLGIPPEEAGF